MEVFVVDWGSKFKGSAGKSVNLAIKHLKKLFDACDLAGVVDTVIEVRVLRSYRMSGQACIRLTKYEEIDECVIIRCKPDNKGGAIEFKLTCDADTNMADVYKVLQDHLYDNPVEEEDEVLTISDMSENPLEAITVAKAVVAKYKIQHDKIEVLRGKIDGTKEKWVADRIELEEAVQAAAATLDSKKGQLDRAKRKHEHELSGLEGQCTTARTKLAKADDYQEAMALLERAKSLLAL